MEMCGYWEYSAFVSLQGININKKLFRRSLDENLLKKKYSNSLNISFQTRRSLTVWYQETLNNYRMELPNDTLR